MVINSYILKISMPALHSVFLTQTAFQWQFTCVFNGSVFFLNTYDIGMSYVSKQNNQR